MPLILHRASHPEALVEALGALLDLPPADPFTIEPIAVHSGGLEQWIAMQVAQRNGICSAVTFLPPDELVARLAAETLGEPPDWKAWTAGRLTWALLATLPDLLPNPELAPVRDYVDAEGPGERTLRLVTLAQRLARVFQDYGTFRPDLVRSWQTNRPDEPWEAPVWRALEAQLGATHLTAWADRLAAAPPATGERVFVYGTSTLPPLTLRLLAGMAASREVHLFVLHPSSVAWARAVPAHPLLASMATLALDLRDALGGCSPVDAPCPDPEVRRDTLLHALQADLLEDTVRPYAPEPSDRSVQVHVCTSPVRQVQALRDVLLTLLDDPTLEPRDIVVMCPDIETYAPWIDAEFSEGAPRWDSADAHPSGFGRLPYRLADRGVRSQNPVADALLRFLELLDGRFEAPSVVELLDIAPVRDRFGLASDDLPAVRERLVAAGARWGRDRAHRVALELPDDDRFTWRYALDRLLLAQALAEPERVELFDHSPDCPVEGRDERAVLGGLVDFAETVLADADALAGDRTPDAWFRRLALTVDRLTDDDPEQAWQKRQVLDALVELAEAASDARFDAPVDLRTARALLGDRFAAREPGRGFLGGAITVCELVPLRSIPFRVVCLLGIDETVFPRVQSRPGYDRMSTERRPGDRDARVDDRALFLEAIQSARQTLVVTCTGRSDTTGRPVPLAVPVAELLEAMRSMVGPEAAAGLRTDHPLQPWSPDRFTAGSAWDRRMREAAVSWRVGRQRPERGPGRFTGPLPPAEPLVSLTLAELGSFWRHPPSELVRRRLGISLWEDDTDLTNDLPFELGYLESWSVTSTVLDAGLKGRSLAPDGELARQLRRRTVLSMGALGEVELRDHLEAVEELLAGLRPTLAAPLLPVDVDLPLAIRLSGRVDRLYADGRLVVLPGAAHPRTQLDLWVHHLALHASGWTGTSTVVGPRGGVRFRPVDRDRALQELDALCKLVGPALDAPMLFWADVSHAAWLGSVRDPAWGAYLGARGMWDRRSDREKQVDDWTIEGVNPFHPDFPIDDHLPGNPHPSPILLAQTVWAPAIEHREELE